MTKPKETRELKDGRSWDQCQHKCFNFNTERKYDQLLYRETKVPMCYVD